MTGSTLRATGIDWDHAQGDWDPTGIIFGMTESVLEATEVILG